MKTIGFKQYRRKQISELRPVNDNDLLQFVRKGVIIVSDNKDNPLRVSISEADLENGSPKIGDMIARNPKNHLDQWLVAKQYFEDNFEEAIMKDKDKKPITHEVVKAAMNAVKDDVIKPTQDMNLSDKGKKLVKDKDKGMSNEQLIAQINEPALKHVYIKELRGLVKSVRQEERKQIIALIDDKRKDYKYLYNVEPVLKELKKEIEKG